MRTSIFLLTLGLAVITASPTSNRIVGGSLTSIGNYPMMAAMLFSRTGAGHRQSCGGTIINNRSILGAAHCTAGTQPVHWRGRVGSTNANSGGVIHNTNRIIQSPCWNARTTDCDIVVHQMSSAFAFNNNVRVGNIAGANFNVGDNQVVWAAGWGHIAYRGSPSEQLRHVQVWTVNQNTCRQRYATIGRAITDNMLCSGWLDVGGRDQCQGDSGGPLLLNNVVVGVCSFGFECARPFFPGVNARVSRFTNWIRNNA